jgi:hypothetical protein
VTTLIASGMVTTRDCRRGKWVIAERSPKAFMPWVKPIDQMGAGPGQLVWVQDRVSPHVKAWPFVVRKVRWQVATLEAVKSDHAMQFRASGPCADGKLLPSHKADGCDMTRPVGMLINFQYQIIFLAGVC